MGSAMQRLEHDAQQQVRCCNTSYRQIWSFQRYHRHYELQAGLDIAGYHRHYKLQAGLDVAEVLQRCTDRPEVACMHLREVHCSISRQLHLWLHLAGPLAEPGGF